MIHEVLSRAGVNELDDDSGSSVVGEAWLAGADCTEVGKAVVETAG